MIRDSYVTQNDFYPTRRLTSAFPVVRFVRDPDNGTWTSSFRNRLSSGGACIAIVREKYKALILDKETIILQEAPFPESDTVNRGRTRGFGISANGNRFTWIFSFSGSTPYEFIQYDEVPSTPVTCTLTAAGWNAEAKTQTVEIGYVSEKADEQVIRILPVSSTDRENYISSGISCTGQEKGKLIFSAGSVPSIDISLRIDIRYAPVPAEDPSTAAQSAEKEAGR